MGDKVNRLTLLVRRQIEAGITAPLIKGFTAEVRREKTLEIIWKVIRNSRQKVAGWSLK
jgi:hypothetical protein